MEPPYTILHQGTERDPWLAARNLCIGASEVPIILGATSYGSELEVYARKCGDEPDPEPQEDSEPMLWGRLLEPAIRDETARRAGVYPVQVVPQYTILQSTRFPWLSCTPDGMTAAGEPAEVKAIGYGYQESEWENGIPERWSIQAQSQLIVTAKTRGLFGALLWGQRLVWCWVEEDIELQRRIIIATEKLWRRIEHREPPPSNGSESARKTAILLAGEREPASVLGVGFRDTVTDWERAKSDEAQAAKAAAAAKKRRRAAEDAIMLAMGQSRRAVLDDWAFVKTSKTRAGYVVKPAVVEDFKVIPPQEEEVA